MKEQNLLKIAESSETPPEQLFILSKHQSEYVRAAVASNPNANETTLLCLVGDSSPLVKEHLKGAKSSFKIEPYEFSITKNSKLSIANIDDAKFIISLRENPSLNKYLSQVESDVEKQRKWLIEYKKREANRSEFYFIIKELDGNNLGTVRLYDFQLNSFCWGSWIIDPNSPRKTAIESAINIYEFAFSRLGFSRSHFDVRNENIKVINFHKRMGARIEKANELDTYFTITKEDYEESKKNFTEFLAN